MNRRLAFAIGVVLALSAANARADDKSCVRDNLHCGGFNVSFSGMYRRAKK